MKKFSSEMQKRGEMGESVACLYLLKQGFSVLERNHTKKWGEIDIIAWKSGVFHFVEVKSVTRENFTMRPEDSMHRLKQHKLARSIEIYVNSRSIETWQFDVACVYLDLKTRKARVKLLENIILC